MICGQAEAFDGCEDLVGGFCPFIRLWVLVVLVDEGLDIGFEILDRCVDATLDFLSGQFREPTLDLVDPGGRCWREVDMVVGPMSQQALVASVLWVA